MKKGDKVKIYCDPFTEKKLEGVAVLVKRITQDSETECWEVRFPDGIYVRTIKRSKP